MPVNWDEAFARACELFDSKRERELAEFLAALERESSEGKHLRTIVRIRKHLISRDIPKVLGLSGRLSSQTTESWFLVMANYYRYIALKSLGNIPSAEEALERSREFGMHETRFLRERVSLLFFSERYREARENLELLRKVTPDWEEIVHLSGFLDLVEGNPQAAALSMKKALKTTKGPPGILVALWETMGMAARSTGDFGESSRAFMRAIEECLALRNSYTVFLMAKYYEMVARGDAPELSPDMLQKAVSLARKGGPGDEGATEEIKAFLLWKKGDLAGATRMFMDAGRYYAMGAQPFEAFMAHLRSAVLARQARSPLFWDALDYLSSRIRLYMDYLANDVYYSEFTRNILLPLLNTETTTRPKVRFYLLGGFRADGPVNLSSWGSVKAVTLFKYLLLNRGNGLVSEYAMYLLWPRVQPRKARVNLKTLIKIIRKNLGPLRDVLCHVRGTYVIQEDPRLWTDAGEFLSLVREADTLSQNPGLQVEKYLGALELYEAKLLPEDRYDRYIEEYRDFFHGMFRKALTRAVFLLADSGREAEALELSGRFYSMFPKDDAVVKVHIDAMLSAGRAAEAEKVYQEFRRRLWREHRMKPSFEI